MSKQALQIAAPPGVETRLGGTWKGLRTVHRVLGWLPRRLGRWYGRQWWSVKARWLKSLPLAPQRTCLFVTLIRDGNLSAHAVRHMQAWHDAGWQVVAIVVADDMAQFTQTQKIDFARAILVRENRGYDFAAWADAIRRLSRRLATLPVVAIANDSVFGPLTSFDAMLDRADSVDADVIGMTDSYEIVHHYQSYLLFFRNRALRSAAFRRFWHQVEIGDRDFVIDRYEVRLLGKMLDAGLRCTCLFPTPAEPLINPTLTRWRELIDAGFPYIKADLLRTNPWKADLTGWETLLVERGYDPALTKATLAYRVASPE
jgi:lipopolysaccharide biosynthesis protein